MEKISVENLFKVFGNNPQKAIQMIRDGMDKDAILEKTGMTVGVNDAASRWVDVEVLEATTSDRTSTEALAEAISLYEGDLLPGFFEEPLKHKCPKTTVGAIDAAFGY